MRYGLFFGLLLFCCLPTMAAGDTGHKNRKVEATSSYSNALEEILNEAMLDSATNQNDSSEVFKYLGRWIGFFMSYADVDLSEEFNLGEILGNVGEIADGVEININLELREMLQDFQRHTFINVYPIPIVNRDEYVFERLNQLMLQWHAPQNSPYINLFLYMQPQAAGQFSVSVAMVPGPTLNRTSFNAVNVINQVLRGKSFDGILSSQDEINDALQAGLEDLKNELGYSLMPDLTVWYEDTPYADGQQIEMWSGSGTADFYAARKVPVNEDSFALDLTYGNWYTDPSDVAQESYFSMLTPPGRFNLTFEDLQEGEKIVLGLNIKEGTGIPSLRSVLKGLVKEVFQEKKVGITDSLLVLRQDSVTIQNEINSVRSEVDNINPIPGNNQYSVVTVSRNTNPQYLDEFKIQSLRANEEKSNLLDFFIMNHDNLSTLNRFVNVERFLNNLINDPQTFNHFLDGFISNSGRLLARFTLNSLDRESKLELKVIFSNYLDTQIQTMSNEK